MASTEPSERAKEVAREFVDKLMNDAAGPNTGSLQSDAEAWPKCGIHESELASRVVDLLTRYASAARLEEAEAARKSIMRCERDWTWRSFKDLYLEPRIAALRAAQQKAPGEGTKGE
jgi:hypothetical protein